ncbi:MAG TPA: YtxH domain-containing protein [Candidatus Deferrimicrobiaceae bacterium]|nr:YtxH domain-containing protein [Candidatus Deferrimicrobiaceae bacterium]
MKPKRNDAVTAAILLFSGAAIGAGIALLFAPASGEKTRKEIADYSRKTRRRAEDLADDLSRSVSGMVDRIGESTQEILERGKDFAEDRKKALLSVIDGGVAKLAEEREKLARLIA